MDEERTEEQTTGKSENKSRKAERQEADQGSCQYYEKTARYGTGKTQGTSEFVRIAYVNAKTCECYYREEIGRELPNQAGSVPHYKVTENALLSQVRKTLKKMK